jgi:hypothetical protein
MRRRATFSHAFRETAAAFLRGASAEPLTHASPLVRSPRPDRTTAGMRLLLGALATLLLLPHGAVAQIIGEDPGCCEDWDRAQFPTLQDFQASTCYGHTCPAGLASIMDVSPCDCRQTDPYLWEGPGSKDVECCYQPCSAGAQTCPDGSYHWRYPQDIPTPFDACDQRYEPSGHGCRSWDEYGQPQCVAEDPWIEVSCPSGADVIDNFPCLNGVCSSDVCCAVGCTDT